MTLADWIDSRHLERAGLDDLARRFADAPVRTIAIDDFLRPDRLADIRRLFATEGEFDERFSRWVGPETGYRSEVVSPTVWRATDDERRAGVQAVFAGPRPEHRLGRGVLAYLKLKALLDSAPFTDFLCSVTKIERLSLTQAAPPRIARHGHFVGPHTDAKTERTMCAVFYVNDGWQQDFGGQFRHLPRAGDEAVLIDPLANRLLLFPADHESRHEVLPLTEAGRNWERWACSFWFGPKA